MIQRFKKLVFYFLFFCIFIGMHSCKNETPREDEFAIHFDITNANQRKIYISELSSEGEILLDSIKLDKNGSGYYIGKVDNRSMYMIKGEGNLRNFLTLLPDSTEIIKLNAVYDSLTETYGLWVCRKNKRFADNIVLDETSLKAMQRTSSNSMECSGFTASDIILPLQKKVRQNLLLIDSLTTVWQTYMYTSDADSIRGVLDSVLAQVRKEQKQLQIKLAVENTTNLVPIYAIYQLFGEQMLLDVNEQTDFDSICAWADRMVLTQRGNPHVDKLKMRMDRLKLLRKQAELEEKNKNIL